MADAPDKPQTHDVPKSLWEKARAKPWTTAAIVLSFLVPVVLGSWLLLQSGGGFSSYPGYEDEGVERSRGDEIPEGSTESTEAEEASEDDEGGAEQGDDAAGSGASVERAPVIAYRKDGALYVSGDDGTGPQEIAKSDHGAFSLSPDGKTLAWIDAQSSTLHLAQVGGDDAQIATADDVAPTWAPDSTWLAYSSSTSAGSEIYRIAADGSGRKKVGIGHTPRVSSDGETIAFISSSGPGVPGDVTVESADGPSLGSIPGAMAIEAVPVAGRVAYTVGGDKDAEEIRVADYDGSDPQTLVDAAKLGVPVVYAGLIVSPDGTLLQYAATGDDGYSRVYVVELEGEPTPFALTTRRDTYPLAWSSDGSRVFIVEGNAFQGEGTVVIGVGPDGLGRAVVIEGGGL